MHTRKERFEALVLSALDNPDVSINTQAFILLTSCFEKNDVSEEEIEFLKNSILFRTPEKAENAHLAPPNVFLLEALMWKYGIGVDAHQQNAKVYFEQAASRKQPFAHACLAEFYHATHQTVLQQAYLQYAIDLGCIHAHYQKGRDICNSGGGASYHRLINGGAELDKAIEQDHLPAMLTRAQLYLENGKSKHLRSQPEKAADLLCRAYDFVCNKLWWEHPLAQQVQSAITQFDKREGDRFHKIRFRAITLNSELSAVDKFSFYIQYNESIKAQKNLTDLENLEVALDEAICGALLEDAHQLVKFIIDSTLLAENEKTLMLKRIEDSIALISQATTLGSSNITLNAIANGEAAIVALTWYLNDTSEEPNDEDSVDSLSLSPLPLCPKTPPKSPQPSFWQPSPNTPLKQKKRSANSAGLPSSPVPAPF